MRRTEVRPIGKRRAISDLLMPARKSFRTWSVWMAAVSGRPRRWPFWRACAKPARTRSRRISLSNSAFCGEPQNADDAKCAIMQSHNAERALWPACQRFGTLHNPGSNSEAISASGALN